MTEDLQKLLEKIQKDGVDKAQSEAAKILADAQAKAKALTDSAATQSAQMKADAQKGAEAFERRAEETIRQAARDTVLNVQKSVAGMLDTLLLKDINGAMSDTSLVPQLAAEAVRAYIGGKDGIEVAAAGKLADALRARLASEAASGVTVVTDESVGSGFSIRLAGGRIEHSFTGKAVAEALSKQLRPRLAALLK